MSLEPQCSWVGRPNIEPHIEHIVAWLIGGVARKQLVPLDRTTMQKHPDLRFRVFNPMLVLGMVIQAIGIFIIAYDTSYQTIFIAAK